MRNIEVPTDTHTEFELGDTAADIQSRREEREQREKEAEAQKQGEREGGSQELRNSAVTDRGASGQKTKRSESKMDTEGGGEAGIEGKFQRLRCQQARSFNLLSRAEWQHEDSNSSQGHRLPSLELATNNLGFQSS